jgi:hypothetical protein
MGDNIDLSKVKPGAKLRITPVGVMLTVSVEGTVSEARDDLLKVSLSEVDAVMLVKRGHLGEFLVRFVEQGVDAPMVLADADDQPGQLAFKPSPENRRRFVRVMGDFMLAYELLENEQQCEEAAYNLEHSVVPEEEAAIFDNEELRGPVATQLLRLESMIGMLNETVNELAEKTDYLVARADGREGMLPRRRRGKMLDVSGSGFAFVSNDEELAEGAFILASFEISPVAHQKVRCVGQVVKLRPHGAAVAKGALDQRAQKQRAQEQRVAVDFNFITEDDQDKIIKYAFSVQRQFLRVHRDAV